MNGHINAALIHLDRALDSIHYADEDVHVDEAILDLKENEKALLWFIAKEKES